MRAAARWLSIFVTVAAAVLAALVVVPAPNQPLAFLAVFVDEKTFVLIAAALAAAVLARLSGARAWIFAQAAFAVAIVTVSALPLAQAARLSTLRHARLDWARYLTATVDRDDARPAVTVTYANVGGRALSLDVYRPATRSGPAPAIVVVHGGGWTAGDKGEAPRASAFLAQHGYAVFDVQYRLAPPPTWQAAVGDVKCAIGWVKRRARTVNVDVDPTRVALLGRSAGGHLALLAAYAPDDPALPASCEAGDTSVARVVSFYGPTDLAWAWDHPTNPRVFDLRERVTSYTGATPDAEPARYRLLSPMDRATAASPPTLLLQGGRDAFVPAENAERLARRLTEVGVPHDVLLVPYAQHAFDFIVGGLAGQLAENAVLRFLQPLQPSDAHR